MNNNLAQIISNSEKTLAGKAIEEEVKNILDVLRGARLIIDFSEDVSVQHRDYKYVKQFKLDFVLQTLDNKYILIRTSSSYRSDRVKIFSYDFFGVQNFSDFSNEVVASIFLFPDKEQSNSTFISNRKMFNNKEIFSPATHWLTFSEFKEYIGNYCSELETINNEDDEKETKLIGKVGGCFGDSQPEVKEKDGSYYGVSGNEFERYLVPLLNDQSNLISFKYNLCDSLEYKVVVEGIVEELKISKHSILFIKATNTIGKLKNLGSPKTDIHIKVYTDSISYHVINLSLKNTKSPRVSCHDYQAKDFVRVIAPNDDEFKKVIFEFQSSGNWRDFDKAVELQNVDFRPYDILNSYMEKIIKWAITGDLDEDNIIDREKQIANFILTRNSETGECHFQSTHDYIERLKLLIGASKGAPFSWTYPSKSRGQRIQLKMPVYFD